VITIDLNPLSRTSKAANITIVDNIVRAMPSLIEAARKLKDLTSLKKIVDNFDNRKSLQDTIKIMKGEI
ncbi:MAG: phosphopantothenate/pantothenate synthetase family protein, partial [Thermoproteota archaeon]|nr:phosphopantothenate/pantothenate synthetase family protein [Thermoproteota archaeon]